MTHWKRLVLVVLFVFVAFAFLSPNPYGNNPDILSDESYFLTSSLEAMRSFSLPGWEFSASGAYYGGTQAYIDFLVLLPVIGVTFIASGFSLVATQIVVALHTGEYLHILRLVNGALSLGALAWGVWYFRTRADKTLGLTLGLFALLLLSNAFTIQFLHTAKVWSIWIILVGIAGTFFIAEEQRIAQGKERLLTQEQYAGLLLWTTAFAFFQVWIAAAMVGLIGVYALVLKHVRIADFVQYVLKRWYLFVLLFVLQASFMYRAYFVNWLSGSFSEISPLAEGQGIDWLPRLLNPFVFMWEGALLNFVLWVAGLLLLALAWRSLGTRGRTYGALMALFVPATYVIFHVVIGFSGFYRYGVIVATAMAFSTAALIGLVHPHFARLRPLVLGSVVAGGFAFILSAQAINLYWKPSSEVLLEEALRARFTTSNIALVNRPEALRLTLPLNAQSLAYLSEKRAAMSRFAFLRTHSEEVDRRVDWKPLTAIAYSEEELASTTAELLQRGYDVWTITNDCSRRCSTEAVAAGNCLAIHESACTVSAADVVQMGRYLSANRLGSAYFVEKVTE